MNYWIGMVADLQAEAIELRAQNRDLEAENTLLSVRVEHLEYWGPFDQLVDVGSCVHCPVLVTE